MIPASPVDKVGYYCGRFAPGFFGEPQNSFTNLAFIAGAVFAWYVWRKQKDRDRWQLPLFALAGSIGVFSFIFHSVPTRLTLQLDLLPIQLFGLAYLAYIGRCYLRLSWPALIVLLVGFFLARQLWIGITPRGALGGGISHVPAVAGIFFLGLVLLKRGIGPGRCLIAAGGVYVLALFVRAWDLYLCPIVPFGVHWLWHILTALAAGLLIYGIARTPPHK